MLSGGVYHLPYPSADTGVSCEDGIKALERLVSVQVDVESIGAVILEPVQGEGGFGVGQRLCQASARFLQQAWHCTDF